MRKILVLGASIVGLIAPSFAFAVTTGQAAIDTSGLNASIIALTNTVNILIPFGLAVAVVVFIYGIIVYILAKKQEDQKAARGYIIMGIIGIAVILAVLGLARLLVSFIGVDNTPLSRDELPSVEVPLSTE